MYNFYVYNFVHVHISLISGANCARAAGLPILAQDFQIKEGLDADLADTCINIFGALSQHFQRLNYVTTNFVLDSSLTDVTVLCP